jgi:hypothetical protein
MKENSDILDELLDKLVSCVKETKDNPALKEQIMTLCMVFAKIGRTVERLSLLGLGFKESLNVALLEVREIVRADNISAEELESLFKRGDEEKKS